jgi:hypothetical protein
VYLDHLQDARAAIALLPQLSQLQPPSALVRMREPLDEVGWRAAWSAPPDAVARDNITRFASEWRFVKPTLDGHDVQTITGLKPGRLYGVLLRRLRDAWLDGEITTPDEEKVLLLRLVGESGTPSSSP